MYLSYKVSEFLAYLRNIYVWNWTVTIKTPTHKFYFRYLTKDQVKGKSSVDAYINALQRGCKCLERMYTSI